MTAGSSVRDGHKKKGGGRQGVPPAVQGQEVQVASWPPGPFLASAVRSIRVRRLLRSLRRELVRPLVPKLPPRSLAFPLHSSQSGCVSLR